MNKRRFPRKHAPVVPQTQHVVTQTPWYKRMWVVVSAVGAIAFSLGLHGPTLLQNIRKMPAEVHETTDQYMSWLKEDKNWEGDWSNFPEGIVNMADMQLSEDVDLKISISSKNGQVDGMIATGAICKNVPYFDFLMLRGNVSGDTAHLEAWDIVGGKSRVFAKIDLVRKDDVITVKPLAGAKSWFPNDARIGRHPSAEPDFMSGYCKEKRK